MHYRVKLKNDIVGRKYDYYTLFKIRIVLDFMNKARIYYTSEGNILINI